MGEEQIVEESSSSAPVVVSTTTTTTGGQGEDCLRLIIDEIDSLSGLSHTIRVFTVKWQVIRKKLEELSSFFVAVGAHQLPSLDNDVFSSLTNTLNECRALAARCISVSYSGKLLMQSDLDQLISKFDCCGKTLTTLYRNSGVVTGDLALVVLKPPIVSASREDMRFYIKDLFTRIKIGDTQMKRQALVSLNEAMLEDEKYVKIVVEIGDTVLLLASCLDSSDVTIQEECSFATALISGFECYKGVLIASGAIGSLIRVVEIGSLKAKEYAIKSLERLTENGDNAWALSAHGGVTALLNLCSRDEFDVELIGPSCLVLRNLVGVEEIKRFMIEGGAISTCIKLIKGRNEMAQIGASEFLQSMASGDDIVRQMVIREGGVRGLVRMTDPKSNYSFKLKETALRAIENLCYSSVEYVNLLISYGFIDQILFFLRKGEVSIQELAFKSACRLCSTSDDARKAMGDGGFMSEFIKFLEAKSYEIREMAAEALSSMVLVPKNRKKFANDDHNIHRILQLLDPKEGNSGNFKFLLSILLSLSSCNHARKRIAHSGYVKNIEKLADAGVTDAKKIVRKLSTNRFRSMLNGIWHS